MVAKSQTPPVVVVAGVAGSGKTTLGRSLARALDATVLDLDAVTNPLLDALGDALPGPHWLSGPHAARIRAGRYAALRTVAAEQVAIGRGAVLIAPFTAELTGGAEWDALVTAVAPAAVHVIHLDGDPALIAARREARGETRDAHRPDVAPPAPRVPHTRIDVLLDPAQQLFRALQALGMRSPVDPSAALFERTFDAVLSDLDGTLLDSTAAVLRSWARLAGEYAFPIDAVQRNHGRPAHLLLAEELDPAHLEAAAARIVELETADVDGIAAIPGALALLRAVPADRLAIVTSGRIPIAAARMAAAGIPRPGVVVTADDVKHGKPDPEPYLLAASRLGVDPARCLVLEDAAAGIRAARAAGCAVLAVRGTSSDAELADADLLVDSLDAVRVVPASADAGGGIRLTPAS